MIQKQPKAGDIPKIIPNLRKNHRITTGLQPGDTQNHRITPRLQPGGSAQDIPKTLAEHHPPSCPSSQSTSQNIE